MYREHNNHTKILTIDRGLSLCVQGTLAQYSRFRNCPRFIPVCTGNTREQYYQELVCAVYPCVYREHFWNFYFNGHNLGLSLCVQGTHIKLSAKKLTARFIPVCTGNTPIITYCFIIKILTAKFLPIF